MPFEIKNTKDFPYFKDFFKHEAACIVRHSAYNKLVMHIKMSWMRSIKRLPPILQEQAMTDNHTERTSTPGLHGTLQVRLAYSKMAVRMVRGHGGRGGRGEGLPWWDLMFPLPCTLVLPPQQQLNGR